MDIKVSQRQATWCVLIGILLFFWSDFVYGFLKLDSFTSQSVQVVAVNDMGSVYWSNLKSGENLVEGYFHFRPEVGQTYKMITSDNAVYFDSVDRLAMVDGELNHSGGILVLNLTKYEDIKTLGIVTLWAGWILLAFGIINIHIHKRRNKHVS